MPVPQVDEYKSPLASVFKHPVVVVAIDIAPVEPLMESIEVEVVAVPVTVVVAKYKLPPAFLKAQ